jgi:hypothetical protein
MWNTSGGPFRIWRGKDKPHDEVKMKSVGPTRGGMMNFHALSRLADGGEGVEWIIKTGGPSDMLAAMTFQPPELRESHLILTNASSETGDILAHQVALFVGRRAVLIHDADKAGEVGAVKWTEALKGRAAEIRHVRLPWPVAEKGGRDLRDFFRGVSFVG